MPEIVSIKVDTRKVENMLNGYIRNMPELGNRVSKKVAGMYATMYLTQLPRSKISPFTGHLFTKLQGQMSNPIKLGKATYGVEIPQYAVWLDSMPSHWVSLRRRPMLRQWVMMKVKDTKKAKWFISHKKVHVNPHPFIKSANIRAGKQVRNIAEWEVNKFLTRKGR